MEIFFNFILFFWQLLRSFFFLNKNFIIIFMFFNIPVLSISQFATFLSSYIWSICIINRLIQLQCYWVIETEQSWLVRNIARWCRSWRVLLLLIKSQNSPHKLNIIFLYYDLFSLPTYSYPVISYSILFYSTLLWFLQYLRSILLLVHFIEGKVWIISILMKLLNIELI